jgi:hypothetical protein
MIPPSAKVRNARSCTFSPHILVSLWCGARYSTGTTLPGIIQVFAILMMCCLNHMGHGNKSSKEKFKKFFSSTEPIKSGSRILRTGHGVNNISL